jgi:hypothetical protein
LENNYINSSFREKLVEHLFVGSLLRKSWIDGDCSLEVSKPEVDNSGYDLIIERGSVIRHIQLKNSRIGAKAAMQKVHILVGAKPAGCVVCIFVDEITMDLGPFMFFGAGPNLGLPDIQSLKVAKHTKGNAEGVKKDPIITWSREYAAPGSMAGKVSVIECDREGKNCL